MFVLRSRSERLVLRLPMDDDLVAVVALVAGAPGGHATARSTRVRADRVAATHLSR